MRTGPVPLLQVLSASEPLPTKSKARRLSDRDIELRLKELQAVGLFTCLCFLGAVIDLILN
jgi:hypothetical protein